MKKYFDYKNIIIVVLILLALLEFLNPKGFMPNRTVKVTQIDSVPVPVYDTVVMEVETEVEVPVTEIIEKTVEVEVPTFVLVDTLAILKLFSENKQTKKDVLQLPDNAGTVTIFDTILHNKILNRTFTSKVKQKIVRDTVKIPEPIKNVLYVGFDAKMDKPNVINLLGASLVYKTKDEKLYRVGVGVSNRVIDGTNGFLTPYVGGGIYWPIKLKK